MAEKSKYDTNPLDPDYGRRAEDVWGAKRVDNSSGASATEDISGATREMGRTPNEQARRDEKAEAPTRRYDQPLSTSYPSVFIPPPAHPPAAYGATAPAAPAAATMAQPPTSRTVRGINMPENVTMVLPYVPFYIGAIVAAAELYLVPRNEVRTRFHAAQGLALHMVILVIGFLFSFAGRLVSSTLGGVAAVLIGIASAIFGVAAIVFLIISIIRVWKGEEHHIAALDDATRWLNEKIEPRR
ncbi:MAG TPA: hypothetical protein VIW80_00855 [Pyrinomonadaceae bacterium]|jgi:uncharacterized membrane protein